MGLPFVSVIIVNYNGARYLPACLDALLAQTYPSNHFEVIVSDNGSTDGSLELLRGHYVWVRLLANQHNLGFASGNNVAIKIARGEYIVLLNNDTIPSPTWLENLVNVAESHPHAGMVTGRLQLFYDQLVLTFHTETFVPDGRDTRELGVQVFEVDSGTPGGVYQYIDGFYGWETKHTGQRFRWMGHMAKLGVPVPRGEGEWQIHFRLADGRGNGRSVPVKVMLNDKVVAEWSVSSATPVEYVLRLPAEARALAMPLVQNAGSIVFYDGRGRDRGTWVRGAEVFYEIDNGQYNRIEEVFAGCGANLLIRRAMLDQIGMFDDDFFMYYEDTDLSWRARLHGWKVFYAPQAIVRHIHCGTSQEWSPSFIYYTDRNRLAMVWKNGTRCQILWAVGKYIGRMLINIVKTMYAFLSRQGWRAWAHHVRIELQVVCALVKWLPTLELKRQRIQRSRTARHEAIATWFLE